MKKLTWKIVFFIITILLLTGAVLLVIFDEQKWANIAKDKCGENGMEVLEWKGTILSCFKSGTGEIKRFAIQGIKE